MLTLAIDLAESSGIIMVGHSSERHPRVPGRPRILVADDEEPLLRALHRTLEAAGFDVRTAEDGSQALALLDAEPTFDAILTDCTMPGTDGIALLRSVRERDLDVPVLLMTGNPGLDSAREAVRLGACDYLVKPVSSAQLVATLRRVLAMSALARTRRESLQLLDAGRPAVGDPLGLAITLDRALESLWIAYQPIVDARVGIVFGYEALLRSNEPALPHPGAVLEAAERLGRIDEVGRAVRAKAPLPMSAAPLPALLFVNLHASDLNDETLTSPSAPLTQIASRVVLEVTERESLDAVPDIRARVARLRELGFRIAVDDLGAGYAGLTAFAHLEPEFVKLDMSLIRGVDESAIKQKLIRSMTALCKDMGIIVVAEGIETAEERDAIVDLGCDLLQGYLLARPGKPFPEVRWEARAAQQRAGASGSK